MERYRKTSHVTYDLKYHLVWITKYRKPVMGGKIAERARELIRQVCETNEVEILAGHISKDHVHLWARGYFAANSGNVTDEVIMEYIKNQDIEENQRSDNFSLEDF